MTKSKNAPDGLSDLDDLSGLNNERKLPHLSKTIVYETDIAPYPFIGIHAGVGSGKNYFIDMLARGYTDPDESGHVQHFPRQAILLVTSRRVKVNEALNDKTIKKDRWIGQWDDEMSYAYNDLQDFEDALGHMRTIDCSADPWGQEPPPFINGIFLVPTQQLNLICGSAMYSMTARHISGIASI